MMVLIKCIRTDTLYNLTKKGCKKEKAPQNSKSKAASECIAFQKGIYFGAVCGHLLPLSAGPIMLVMT
jgi:hypothetical protein